jgi:hypothetical protein
LRFEKQEPRTRNQEPGLDPASDINNGFGRKIDIEAGFTDNR